MLNRSIDDITILPQNGAKSTEDKNLLEADAKLETEKIFMIPWGHNKAIIDKCKGNYNKAIFYVQKMLENNWSRAVLLSFLI